MITNKLKKWSLALSAILLSLGTASASDEKAILMLVTGADKMTNGKPTGLWLEEFAVPYQEFKEAGFSIKVVTPEGGAAPIDPRSNPTPEKAAAWKEASKRLIETKPLATAQAEEFSALFISGGHGVMFDLVDNEASTKLIGAFEAAGKPIAAVCHGPAALVNVLKADGTPLVKGKKVTAFTDSEERAVKLDQDMPFLLESKLRELGAKIDAKENFTAHAVQDGMLITGQNPASSEATAKLLVKALSQDKK